MSQELIYTSAPRGLKPGSRGFCTVVSTFGMPANLAQRLESLSGYRHVYGPQDAEARLNPVVFSHLLLTVGGRPYHVLSRIADAGLDYSQRTNKLAHHVVLDVAERVPGGPAWLLRQPGFVETAFDGEPRVLQAGRKPPSGAESPGVCHHWARLTGDAGWGGALAEAAVLGRKAYLVFRPGMDVLPLLAESFALLPPERRWGVTFSTYFTGLPPGVDCQIACVLDGSHEHARTRQTRDALVIDLFRPAGLSPESAYAQAARSGDVTALAAPISRPAAEPVSSMEGTEFGSLEQALSRLIGETAPAGIAGRPSRGVAAGSPPPRASRGSDSPLQRPSPIAPRRFRRKEAARWPYVVLAMLGVLILIGSGTAIWLAGQGETVVAESSERRPLARPKVEEAGDEPEAEPQEQPEAEELEEQPAKVSESPENGPVSSPAESVNGGERPAEVAADDAAMPGQDDTNENVGPAEAAASDEAAPEVDAATQLAPVVAAWPEWVGIVPEDAEKDEEGWYTILTSGLLRDDVKVELELIGLKRLFQEDMMFQQEEPAFNVSGKRPDLQRWHVRWRNTTIATFQLHERGLRFRWGRDLSEMSSPRPLRNCILLVRTNTDGHHIALRRPIESTLLPLAPILLDAKAVALPSPIVDLPDHMLEHLRWKFVRSDKDRNSSLPLLAIAQDSENVWRVTMRPAGNSDDPLTLQITLRDFKFSRSDDAVRVQCKRLLKTEPVLHIPGINKPVTLEKARIKTLAGAPELNSIQDKRHQIEHAKLFSLSEANVHSFQETIKDYDLAKSRIQRVDDMFESLEESSIGYRVYLKHGSGQMLLLVNANNEPADSEPKSF